MFERLYDKADCQAGEEEANNSLILHGADPTTLQGLPYERVLSGVRAENVALVHGLEDDVMALDMAGMLDELSAAGQTLAGTSEEVVLRTRSFAWMPHPTNVVSKNGRVDNDVVRAIRGYELAWLNGDYCLDRRTLLLYRTKRTSPFEADPAKMVLGPGTVRVPSSHPGIYPRELSLYDLLENDMHRAAIFEKLAAGLDQPLHDSTELREFIARSNTLNRLYSTESFSDFTNAEFQELFAKEYEQLRWMERWRIDRSMRNDAYEAATAYAQSYLLREEMNHKPGPAEFVGDLRIFESSSYAAYITLKTLLTAPQPSTRIVYTRARILGISIPGTMEQQSPCGTLGRSAWEASDPGIDRARIEQALEKWTLQALQPPAR